MLWKVSWPLYLGGTENDIFSALKSARISPALTTHTSSRNPSSDCTYWMGVGYLLYRQQFSATSTGAQLSVLTSCISVVRSNLPITPGHWSHPIHNWGTQYHQGQQTSPTQPLQTPTIRQRLQEGKVQDKQLLPSGHQLENKHFSLPEVWLVEHLWTQTHSSEPQSIMDNALYNMLQYCICTLWLLLLFAQQTIHIHPAYLYP